MILKSSDESVILSYMENLILITLFGLQYEKREFLNLIVITGLSLALSNQNFDVASEVLVILIVCYAQ